MLLKDLEMILLIVFCRFTLMVMSLLGVKKEEEKIPYEIRDTSMSSTLFASSLSRERVRERIGSSTVIVYSQFR